MENEVADVCYVIQVDICLCQQNFLWNAPPPLKRVSRQIFHVIARMQRVSQVLSCSNLGKRPISAEQPVFVSVACMMWPVLLGAAHIIKPNPYLDMPQQKQKHLKTPVWLIILRTVLTEIKSYPFCFWKCYMGGKNNKHSVTGSNACSCKNYSPQCKSLMT